MDNGDITTVPFVPMDQLPESVQQFVEVIGEAATLELVKRYPRSARKGDTPFRPVISIPAKLNPDHPLVSIIGLEKAAKLSKVFGGEQIFLAMCANVVRSDRDRAIAEAMERHTSPAAIAIRFNMSERHVRRIVTRIRADIHAMGNADARGQHRAHHSQAMAA